MVLNDYNEGENSFRRLAENLPGIVYRVLIEDNNRKIFFNDMVQTMTGYSPDELKKGKVCSIDPLILPEDRLNVINIVKDAIENNVPFEVEYRINNKSGEVKWFSERGRPIKGANGNPSYIDGVIFDITYQKEVEKRLKTSEESLKRLNKELEQKLDEGKIGLRESEKKFKSVFDDSPIGIELYDSNGKLVEINDSCLDIFGVSSIDDVADFDLFKDPNVPKEQLKKLKKGQIVRYEILFDFDLVKDLNLYETKKSGKIWIDVLISPLYLEENNTISNYLVQLQVITERKITEQKLKVLNEELDKKIHERTKQLKKSEEKYRLITENVSDLISVSDQNMNYEFVNEKAFLNILGRSKEEMIGKSPLSWVHPEDAEKIIEAFKIGFEKGKGRVEARFKDNKGIYHWFDIKGKTFTDHDGKKKALTISRDTTQHKKAEQKIIQEREKANLYLNVVEVILVALDRDEIITLLNKKGHELLGYNEGELIGKNWFEVCLPPHDSERVHEYFKKLMAGEMELIKFYENPIWAKTGEERLISWSSVLFKDENGKVTGLLASGVDITERKKAEQKLISEKEKAQKYLDIAGVILLVLNTDQTVQLINRKGCEILGDDESEIIGINWIDKYIPEENRELIKKEFNRFVNGEIELFEYIEKSIIIKNGEKRIIAWHNTALKNEAGQIIGSLSSGEDITERKKAELNLKKSEEIFKKQNVFLNNILESLTHPFYVINVKDYSVVLANSTASSEGLEHGKSCYNLTHGNAKPCEAPCICPLDEVKRTKKTCVVEHIHYDEEGNEKIYEIYGYPILDESGNVVQMIEYALNISERKKAENDLRKIARQWRTTFDAMSECVLLLDLEANILQCNQVTLDFFGKNDYDEIIEHSCFEIIHGDSSLEDRCPIIRMLESNKTETSLARIGNKYCKISANPVINDEGNLMGAVQIITDITERRKTEAALRESEEGFRNLIEQSIDGVILVNENGLIIEWNKGQEQITGLKKEDVIGRPIWDVQIQTDAEQDKSLEKRERIKGMIKDTLKTGDAQWIGKSRDINIQRVDNKEIRTLQQLTFLIKNENKIMLGNFSRDITERKKAEQELIESEEKFRTIAEQSFMGIVIIQDGLFKYFNQRATEMNGYSVEEIQNWKPYEFAKIIHPEDRDFVMEQARKKQEGQNDVVVHHSYRVIKKSGEIAWVDNYSKTINYKGRSADLVMTEDITDKIITEQQLKESEEKFRTIAERTFMGIIIVQDNQVKYINEALLNMFEYSQKEIADWEMDDLTKLIHPEDLSFIEEYRENLKRGDINLKPYYSYRALTKSGKVKWIDQFSKEIQYKGRPAELVTIMDITEKKEVELELIKLNNLKSELLRRTSHELRTPLVSIKGFSDLLLELYRDKLDDYVIKTIKQIKGGCSRLEALVNDILKTAELESGTVKLKKSKEDLSLLIKVCVRELEGLSELRDHTINLEIPDELICSFEKEQIYNIFTNILINAIKFTPYNGKIDIKSEINNDFIIVSIMDNGIGFTEQEKTQIFKQFGKIERYGQGYDVISEGSGLGLYISKKIVELHGGEIRVESEGRNKGSTFIISLPLD